MANSISDYFTDEELITQLRLQFDYEEQFDMDFRTVFNHIYMASDGLRLRLRGRLFRIDEVTGDVSEVEL